MTRLAVAFLALSLVACTSKEEQARINERCRDERLDTAYGLVAAHPEQSLVQALDEVADYGDAALYSAIAELVREGRLEVTPKGVRAVPPKRAP